MAVMATRTAGLDGRKLTAEVHMLHYTDFCFLENKILLRNAGRR
jgi:hypothetical protein